MEDVITTGGQVAESTAALRALGATIDHVVCVIDRSDGAVPALDELGLAIRSVLTRADLDQAAAER